MKKILSIVCAYYPDNKRLSMLASTLLSIGDVVIVNNGGEICLDLPISSNNASILDLGRNLGTLASYNLVISEQKKYSYYWLWNQDSEITEEDAAKFIYEAENCFDRNEKTACVTTFDRKNFISPFNKNLILAKESTSIVSKYCVEYHLSGWFDEALFMDYGDWDFCFRLFKAGAEVEQIDGIHIGHQLGDPEQTLLGPVNRPSPMRLHMQGINTAYLIRKHGVFNFPIFLLIARLLLLPFKNFLFDEFGNRNRLFFSGVLWGAKGGLSSNYANNLNRGIK
jgi:rhamnosyltransferase